MIDDDWWPHEPPDSEAATGPAHGPEGFRVGDWKNVDHQGEKAR
jgi:hypothetical protein